MTENLTVLLESRNEFLRFLERRVESREVAEDILQSAFARTLERGANVDEEKVTAWFYRVLRNAVVDHYRRRDRQAVQVPMPTPEEERDICQCVSGLLAGLKPEYREALQTVDMEDGSLKQLAEQAGITAENAAVRIHRARKAMRDRLKKVCGACSEHSCLDCRCKVTLP